MENENGIGSDQTTIALGDENAHGNDRVVE